jgi:hypothetical protein
MGVSWSDGTSQTSTKCQIIRQQDIDFTNVHDCKRRARGNTAALAPAQVPAATAEQKRSYAAAIAAAFRPQPQAQQNSSKSKNAPNAKTNATNGRKNATNAQPKNSRSNTQTNATNANAEKARLSNTNAENAKKKPQMSGGKRLTQSKRKKTRRI